MGGRRRRRANPRSEMSGGAPFLRMVRACHEPGLGSAGFQPAASPTFSRQGLRLRERVRVAKHVRSGRPLRAEDLSTLRGSATPVLRSSPATEDGEDGRCRRLEVGAAGFMVPVRARKRMEASQARSARGLCFGFKEVTSTRMLSTLYTDENGESMQGNRLFGAADHSGLFLRLDLVERQRPPDLQRAVHVAGDEGIAVLGEGQAQNRSAVAGQDDRFLVELRMP